MSEWVSMPGRGGIMTELMAGQPIDCIYTNSGAHLASTLLGTGDTAYGVKHPRIVADNSGPCTAKIKHE